MPKILAILALFLMLAAPVWAEEAAKPAAEAPLDQPLLDDKALVAWAGSAAAETMTFDYRNFQQSFLKASPHFTKHGWQTFSSTLNNSGAFENMRKHNETISAVPGTPAAIQQQGAVDGKYRWTVALPLAVHYKNTDDEEHDATLKLSLVVTRVPLSESADGVQIAEWAAQ